MFQSNSLALIKNELDQVYAQLMQLVDQLERNYNAEYLASFIAYLDQIRGTAKLIELRALDSAAAALIHASNKLSEQSLEQREETLQKISFVLVKSQSYLEFIGEQQMELPELLIPTINELLQHIRETQLRESSFAELPEHVLPLMFDMNAPSGFRRSNKLSRIRLMYQIGLVNVLTNRNSKTGLEMIGNSLMRLAELTCKHPNQSVWWLMGAIVACIHDGQLHLTYERKRLFGEIDRNIREMINSAKKDKLLFTEVELAKNLFYLLSLVPSPQPAVSQLMELYHLKRNSLNEQHLIERFKKFAGPDDGVVKSAISSVYEEINALIDKLKLIALEKNEHHDHILGMLKQELHQIANILQILEYTDDQKEIKRISSLLNSLNNTQDGKHVDDYFDDIIKTLQSVARSLATLEQSKAHSERSKKMVLDEHYTDNCIDFRVIMQRCNQALQHYYDQQKDELLNPLPEQFSKVAQGLTYMDFDQIAGPLYRAYQYLQSLKDNGTLHLDKDQIEALADLTTSVDYYLEGLLSNQTMLDRVVQLAEQSVEALIGDSHLIDC